MLLSDLEIDELLILMKELHNLHSTLEFDSTWKRNWLIKRISNDKDFGVFTKKIKNIIVGYIIFEVRYEEYSAIPYGYIRELYVRKDYRNYHRAKQLMSLVENYFVKRECSRIEFLSSLNNQYRPFFERLSYSTTHFVMGKAL